MQRAILVGLDFGHPDYAEALAEAADLVRAAGAEVCATLGGKRTKPDVATFAGGGKVEEIQAAVAAAGAGWVVFNHGLSPIQIRNLERATGARVVDRTDLILDIFAQRAKSHEGKLQVDLARLEHQLTRLVRGWTHLERQRGGINLRGGPGETQLEIDRRLVADRIRLTKVRLAKLARQRQTQRSARRKRGTQSISIVGYTNAGKSTLFNRLARAQGLVANQLFATLDTTTRRLYLGEGCQVTLSDTVGFIRDLPHGLVAAFRATLEETLDADLLLHVVDASSPERQAHIDAVNAVLAEIGAEKVPQLVVYNKADRCAEPVAHQDPAPQTTNGETPPAGWQAHATLRAVRVSALTGEGLEHLRGAMLAAMRACNRDPSPHLIVAPLVAQSAS